MKPATQLIRFRIDFAENSNIGPGKIELLEGIKVHGSISGAARALNLSYRRAWILLDSLNQSFIEPVSGNSVGGVGGGGVQVTPFGDLLIKRYREVERRFLAIGTECLQDIQSRVNHSGAKKATPVAVKKKTLRRKPKK